MPNILDKYLQETINISDLKEKGSESKTIKMNEEDGTIICPHCGQAIQKGELKVGNDKTVIHGKCKGKVNTENIMKTEYSNLFETYTEYMKGKVNDLLAKAIKNLNNKELSKINQKNQPDERVETDPLQQAKSGERDKTFEPPKHNQ